MSTMAEGTYDYECMRAELLGIEKPNYEDFIKNQQQAAAVQEEEQDTENLKEAELDHEQIKRVSGGLEELNSILQVTQRKITRFKASCGSLTNLLKIKLGQSSSSESVEEVVKTETKNDSAVAGSSSGDVRKSDLAKALDNHVDRLDEMLEKADNAQYSMAHQNKEIKRFLK